MANPCGTSIPKVMVEKQLIVAIQWEAFPSFPKVGLSVKNACTSNHQLKARKTFDTNFLVNSSMNRDNVSIKHCNFLKNCRNLMLEGGIYSSKSKWLDVGHCDTISHE